MAKGKRQPRPPQAAKNEPQPSLHLSLREALRGQSESVQLLRTQSQGQAEWAEQFRELLEAADRAAGRVKSPPDSIRALLGVSQGAATAPPAKPSSAHELSRKGGRPARDFDGAKAWMRKYLIGRELPGQDSLVATMRDDYFKKYDKPAPHESTILRRVVRPIWREIKKGET